MKSCVAMLIATSMPTILPSHPVVRPQIARTMMAKTTILESVDNLARVEFAKISAFLLLTSPTLNAEMPTAIPEIDHVDAINQATAENWLPARVSAAD